MVKKAVKVKKNFCLNVKLDFKQILKVDNGKYFGKVSYLYSKIKQ